MIMVWRIFYCNMFLFDTTGNNTGFGDRFLDFCSSKCIADALGLNFVYYWEKPEFGRIYDFSEFSWGNTSFSFHKNIAYDIGLDLHKFITVPTWEVPTWDHNIIPSYLDKPLYTGGTACPTRVVNSLGYVELSPAFNRFPYDISKIIKGFGLEWFINQYKKNARDLKPTHIEKYIPKNIEECVGIHVRRTDKILVRKCSEEPFAMFPEQENVIHEKLLKYAANFNKFLIVGDDPVYIDLYSEEIRKLGGEVVQIKYHSPFIDFFALSRCKVILQATKYSTFSILASIVGDKELVNFYKTGNLLCVWEEVLKVRYI